VRPLEVVGVDEELNTTLAIGEVRKHRLREKLVPQRLPEALNLPERLRVLRPALDVPDALAAELLLEVRLTPPRRVLAALVGQYLARRAVRRDAATQRLHHQVGLLMVRERPRHEIPRVVVHERRDVEALVSPQEESEDVRLPQLVRLRALEATRTVFACRRRWRVLDEAGLVEDATHLGLRHAEALEALEHVTDAPCPPRRVRLAPLHHRVSPNRLGVSDASGLRCRGSCIARCERLTSESPIQAGPLIDRRDRDSEHRRDLCGGHRVVDDLLAHAEPSLHGVAGCAPTPATARGRCRVPRATLSP